MRAGRLTSFLYLYQHQTLLTGCYAEVRPPKEVGEQTGLREEGQTTVITRYREDVKAGMYLRSATLLALVKGASDPYQRRAETYISCTRLIGVPGVYHQQGGENPITVWIGQNTPYIGLNGQMQDHRFRLEIPAIDPVPSWRPGDAISANGQTYPLTGLDDEGCDGVVVRYTA